MEYDDTNPDITPADDEAKYSKSSAKYKTNNKVVENEDFDVSVGYIRESRHVPNQSVIYNP